MRGVRRMALIAIAGVAALVVPSVGHAAKSIGPNIINNGGFEAAAGGPVTFCGPGGGPAAPPSWGAFNNGGGCTTTEVLPSTAPGGGSQMAHVVSQNDSSGLVQCCFDIDGFLVRAMIKVNSGAARVCVGILGAPPCQLYSAGPTWMKLQAVSGAGQPGQPNEIVIYTVGAADFYVDRVSVQPITLGNAA